MSKKKGAACLPAHLLTRDARGGEVCWFATTDLVREEAVGWRLRGGQVKARTLMP